MLASIECLEDKIKTDDINNKNIITFIDINSFKKFFLKKIQINPKVTIETLIILLIGKK